MDLTIPEVTAELWGHSAGRFKIPSLEKQPEQV
jgi:hypothetical protein